MNDSASSDAKVNLNGVARKVLNDYLDTYEPGYALLVDAPWGAGKTHFIRQKTGCDIDPNCLYISLYGVSSPETFDLAIFRALEPLKNGKFKNWLKTGADLVSKVQVLGNSIDLSGIPIVEYALERLPRILIFDDLERSQLKYGVLSGLINRFVEHKSKNVILVANTKEIKELKSYKKGKEKFVGRTIRIEADIDAALIEFWANIPEGKSKHYLQEIQSMLIGIFRQTETNNLRVFKQALLETTRFVDALDEQLFKFGDEVTRLVRTFFALSMAYISGELSDEQMLDRGDYYKFSNNKDHEQDKYLTSVAKRHPDCDIQGYHGPILPVDIAYEQICVGYCQPSKVNQVLLQTRHFSDPLDIPDWIKLWNWSDLSVEDLSALLEKINTQLDNLEITVPGQILQIFAAMQFMARFGAPKMTNRSLVQRFLKMIRELDKASLLPAYRPETRFRNSYGYEVRGDDISYGNYLFKLDDHSRKILDKLQKAQLKRYNDDAPKSALELVNLIASDPAKFAILISGHSTDASYYNSAILHFVEPETAANIIIELFERDRSMSIDIAGSLKDRRNRVDSDLKEEADWFYELESKLIEKASERSELFLSQIRIFLSRGFGRQEYKQKGFK